MSNALILSGGNVKGSYQAGAIRELLHAGYTPDAIYGVSVGALNGAIMTSLANRTHVNNNPADGIDWPKVGDMLVDIWKTQVTSFKSIGKRRSKFSLGLSIAGIKSFKGMLKMKGADELMTNNIGMDDLMASPVKYRCGVVNMFEGTYANPGNMDGLSNDLLFQYIKASTREPVIMPLEWIQLPGEPEETPFCDGGARDILPVKGAVADGATHIVGVILKRQITKEETDPKVYKKFMKLLIRSTSILTNEVARGDAEALKNVNYMDGRSDQTDPGNIKWALVQPTGPDDVRIDREDFDSSDITRLINNGQAAVQTLWPGGTPRWWTHPDKPPLP